MIVLKMKSFKHNWSQQLNERWVLSFYKPVIEQLFILQKCNINNVILCNYKIRMESIVLKKVFSADVAQLQQIAIKTFNEAYDANNSEQNMEDYIASSFTEKKLHAEISDPNSIFYFAMLGNDIIGYLKVNLGASQTELKDSNALEVERIYVMKAYYGKQVGQALFDKVIEIARLRSVEYIWLGVWEENPRAIRFYEKNGFVAFDTHVFNLGDEEQTDIMMKLRIEK